MKALIIVLVGLIATSQLHGLENTRESNTRFSNIDNTLDKEAGIKITEQEKSLAKQWMLTDIDWVKYKQVMLGPRGIWSPGIDPLTALGVSETDPEERKRYAEIWIRVESRRAELELAFEAERSRAAKRILGNTPVIDNKAWIEEWEAKQIEVRKQVLLFMDVECKEKCQSIYKEVRSSIANNTRLDIYFTGSTESSEIGKWAAFMKIDPKVVKARQITLNFDDGQLSAYDISMTELPQVRVKDLKTGTVTKTFH